MTRHLHHHSRLAMKVAIGADAYLPKPLDVPQFIDVLDRLISTR